MHIIKLDATNSTNSYLRELNKKQVLNDYTVVTCNHQLNGRGQMGTTWESEEGKNLVFSVFKDFSYLDFSNNFYISMAVSLAIIKTLQQFSIGKLKIKWPNDILSEDSKVCGVLIENIIKQDKIKASIIGIGLNVNQTNFVNLPKASSLKLLTGNQFDLNEVLIALVSNLKKEFKLIKDNDFEILKNSYESVLFRKNKPTTFRRNDGTVFTAYIKQVTNSGHLQLLLEDDVLSEFDLKQITLLY